MTPSTDLKSGLAAFSLLLAFGSAALADDKSACADGLTTLRSEIAKLGTAPVPPKLAKALRVAEREQREGEFDECLDALEEAKRALPK